MTHVSGSARVRRCSHCHRAARSTLLSLAGLLALPFPLPAQYSPSQAAGYKAAVMCSAVFLAGREPEDVLRDELGGPDLTHETIGDPDVDFENRAVTVSYRAGKRPRLAVFLEGFGTVLLPPGSTLEDRAMLPQIDPPMPSGDPTRIPWPNGDRLSERPLPPELDPAKLELAVEAAFSHDKYRPHETLGVVVVHGGRIVAERYAPGWGVHTQYRSWSSAKSITSALVGILVEEGKLELSDGAPIPEWQEPGDPRSRITIEHLLHMSSGLRTSGSNTPRAYWGGIDTGAEVAASELEVEPGTRFRYSNYDTLLLVRSIEEALESEEAYLTFPRRALLNKIGMRDTYPEIDPYGNFILSSQMYTTPRDLARFGLLYLNDGVWNGERILPEGWVDYSRRPAPANGQERPHGWAYGAHFWLLGEDPRVPEDTFTTAGARGQLATIVPSRRLVVVRTGLDPRRGSNWDQAELVADVLQAIGTEDESAGATGESR